MQEVKVKRKGKEKSKNVRDPDQAQKGEQEGVFLDVFPVHFNRECG